MRHSMIQTRSFLSACAVFMGSMMMLAEMAAQSFMMDSGKGLQPHNVAVDRVTYRGRKAVRVKSLPNSDAAYEPQHSGTGGGIVLLEGSTFHNGTIEIDVAGKPQANAPALARGFVGIAFRVPTDAARYDYVYIRPTNGRADE